jgi:hypothetical protein
MSSSDISNQYKAARFMANLIVSSSVSKVVREVLRNNIDNETIVDSLRVRIGIMMLSGMLADHTWEVTNARMEVIMAWMTSARLAAQKEEEEKQKEESIAGEIVDDNNAPKSE